MDLSVASSTSSIGDSARKQSLASTPSVLYSPVAVRNITGVCHASNRRAMDWSAACGLIAYGSHALVVVIDPVTLQCVQVLEKHKQSVVRVAWCVASCTAKHPADKLTLASADAAANIIIWNVKSGDAKITLSDTAGKGVSTAPTSSAPVQMAWMDGRVENTAHLLAVLYPPFNFVLWDTNSGAQIWKKTYIETLQGFDMDPFDCSRVAFRCLDCVLIIDDFSTTKAPSANVSRKFYVLGASKTNQGLTSSKSGNSFAGDSKTSDDRTRTKIKRIVRELVTGESQAASGSDATPLSECLQVKFHGAVRNHLLLVYPREVLVLDLDIAQTVGTVATVERNCPAILQISSCWQRDVIFTLNEIGAVAMRVRRKIFTLAATPMEPIRSMSKSVSSLSVSQVPGDNLSDSGSLDAGALEIAYDVKASSETIRLNKNAKIMGMCCNPMSERNIAVFTTDGRIIFYDVLPQATDSDAKSSESTDDPKRPLLGLEDLIPAVLDPKEATPLRLYTNGTFCGLATPPFVIRMCPPLTVKNMNDYSPLLALGAGNGNIQIVNMSTGRVEREFAVHTFPVRGIEWTGLHSMLSHAHQNLSGSSALVRNELIHTDVRTGKSASLRTHRSEETPIDMLRVSHLKQYFIVAFVGAPFELWDLRTMTLLRTMPKKFPPITALDWSPLHNLKSLKKRMNTIEEKDSGAEGKTDGSGEVLNVDSQPQALIAKEHFVFTDPVGQLYHFSVEGNAIRDGTKVPAETRLGTITCIAWKSDHVVRGDGEGNINIWDVKTRKSRNVATNRGTIRKLRFAPGRGNFKLLVLNADSVSIWDAKECELINEVRMPRDISRVLDIDWAASDRAILATAEGCLKIMGLSLTAATSAMFDYNQEETIACHPLLPNKARSNFHNMLHHQPWKEKYGLDLTSGDGFSSSEADFVEEQLRLLPPEVISFLEDEATSSVDRNRVAAIVSGQAWEADFWRVAAASTRDLRLDLGFDLLCDSTSFVRFHLERLRLHETRCTSPAHRKRVVDMLICLGQCDEAVRLLLETAPDSDEYYEDSLRACLISATASSDRSAPHTTMKLVATNLIAEGKIWEGIQLLCLIGKVMDACAYLQSSGQWDSSLWLAKCRLEEEEYAKIAQKYCEHLAHRDQRKQAVLTFLAMKDYVTTLDTLLAAKMVALAAQFLQCCLELKLLPDTSHALVLQEEISLAYARHLFDCGNSKAAFYYCNKADEKGEVLKRELQMLMSEFQDEEEQNE